MRERRPEVITLAKYHCYGNSFFVLQAGVLDPAAWGPFSKKACDLRFGIGGDGCVFVQKLGPDQFRLTIFNQDGTEARMSGNGARCAAAWLKHTDQVTTASPIRLETAGGLKVYRLTEDKGLSWEFESEMGEPDFAPEAVPFVPPGPPGPDGLYEIPVGEDILRAGPLAVGNPQCPVLLDEVPSEEEFQKWGRGLETHSCFPDRANISFLNIEDRHRVRIRIWERGVGPTSSSGTGCCGAAVRALTLGLVDSPVWVQTDAGRQLVGWTPGGQIVLRGNCEFVANVEYFWKLGD